MERKLTPIHAQLAVAGMAAKTCFNYDTPDMEQKLRHLAASVVPISEGEFSSSMSFLARSAAAALGSCVIWRADRTTGFEGDNHQRKLLRELALFLMEETFEPAAVVYYDSKDQDLTMLGKMDDFHRAMTRALSISCRASKWLSSARTALRKRVEAVDEPTTLSEAQTSAIEYIVADDKWMKNSTKGVSDADHGDFPQEWKTDSNELKKSLCVVFLSRYNVLLPPSVLPEAPLLWDARRGERAPSERARLWGGARGPAQRPGR